MKYSGSGPLLLFPFQSKDDLIIEGSYTERLHSVIYNHELEKI